DVERLPELAQSLVRAQASVILAFGPPAIRAAQQATSTIPIVANADLLASGLIRSLARPGGNTTRLSMLNPAPHAQSLEILKELGRLSLTHKLPAICEWREMAEAGCVASYGTRLSEGYAMLAALTDKMLKGAPPGETPAQQPTRFELVINRTVARAIGIEIP